MTAMRTKAIDNIETRMKGVEEGSIRYKVLENAKSFKASWIGLGQTLYTVWKERLYKNWGYAEFDSYTSKEIGIKKATALKLLRSYYFLEKEEPGYLRSGYEETGRAGKMPTLDAVDTLRLAAKKKTIEKADYEDIKKKVLEEGRDAGEVKKGLTQLMRQREELEPEEARRKKREALIRRYIGALRSIKEEARTLKILPAQILNETDKLIARLEGEVGHGK